MRAEKAFKILAIIKVVALVALAIYFFAYGAYMLSESESDTEGIENSWVSVIIVFAKLFGKLGAYVFFAIGAFTILATVYVVVEFLIVPNGARIIFVISDFISNIFLLALVLYAVNSEIFTFCAIMLAFLLYFICVDIAGFISYREYKRLRNASRGLRPR